MVRSCGFCVLIFIFLCIPSPVRAQVKAQQKTAEPASERLRLGQAGSQQELDAYNRLHNETDPAAKRTLIDEFEREYPESGLLAYVYQDGVYLGRQLNDIDMMADFGEKCLQLWPDNFWLRTELASVYVQRNRVEEARNHASIALQAIENAEKPARMTDPQWMEARKMLLASNYATLGYFSLRTAQVNLDPPMRKAAAGKAIDYFNSALELQPMDDFIYYGLGFTYMILNDYPNAESNLAKAVAINGTVIASARSLLEGIYRSQHNQSLEGLEKVIAQAKANLGLG